MSKGCFGGIGSPVELVELPKVPLNTLADVNHVYVAHTPRILHEKHVEPANQAMSWISTVIGGFIPLSCKFWNEAAGSAIIMTVGLVNQGIAHLSAQEAQHQLGNYVGVDGPM